MGRPRRAGFTLIELMVAVGIVGMLCATAIPGYARVVNRSKTAEVSANLNSMFKLAASYYSSERNAKGSSTIESGHCSVDDAGPAPALPLPSKQVFVADSSFRALGFTLADYTYFSYGLAATHGGVSVCGIVPDSEIYTFYANGDLDGDGTDSTFELAAGSDAANVLYHGRAFYIHEEFE